MKNIYYKIGFTFLVIATVLVITGGVALAATPDNSIVNKLNQIQDTITSNVVSKLTSIQTTVTNIYNTLTNPNYGLEKIQTNVNNLTIDVAFVDTKVSAVADNVSIIKTNVDTINTKLDSIYASNGIKMDTICGQYTTNTGTQQESISFGDVDGPLMHVSLTLAESSFEFAEEGYIYLSMWNDGWSWGSHIAVIRPDDFDSKTLTYEFDAKQFGLTLWEDSDETYSILYAATMTYVPEP
jgi:hypothetical protein